MFTTTTRDILNDIVEAMSRPKAASGPPSQRPQKRRHDDSEEKLRAEGGFEESPFTTSGSQPASGSASRWNTPSTQYAAGTSDNPASTSHTAPTFPQSSFDFTLPLHSDELGRLPVWSDEGVDSSMTASGEGTWASLSPDPITGLGTLANTVGHDGGPQLQMDPDLEAIFAGLIPDASWNHAFGVMPQPDFPQSTHTQGATTAGGSHQQQYDASYNYGSSAEEPHMPEWS